MRCVVERARQAEEEERRFYEQRAPDEWLEVLEPLGTDHNKPFLETARTSSSSWH